jgi:hypothetical protein
LVKVLREGGDPGKRVMIDVVWRPPRAPEPEPPTAAPAPPAFAAPELLIRSLVNRIFGANPPVGARDWVTPRLGAIALAGVELGPMLPFLRLVAADKAASLKDDPLDALRWMLRAAGIEPAAWKRLLRLGFEPFEALGSALGPVSVARMANLMVGLHLFDPPPRQFIVHALDIALYRVRQPGEPLDVHRHPVWFMRALLKEVEKAVDLRMPCPTREEVHCCVDWLMDAFPSPDQNQQDAGWAWILEEARAWQRSKVVVCWEVPVAEMTIGPWRVVPIGNSADLEAEARAMKNCLASYQPDCLSGLLAVFSIRDAASGKRKACFTATREFERDPWGVDEVKGKMNRDVEEVFWKIARLAVELMPPASSASKGARP